MELTANDESSYIQNLEARLESSSEALEELHLQAAIDAQLTLSEPTSKQTNLPPESRVSSTIEETSSSAKVPNTEEEPLFKDYTNPNAVRNCLSPFVPTSSERIGAFISLSKLNKNDVLLDIGCGDGRVCIASAKTVGCRVVGIDVSPACISAAIEIAKEEGLQENMYSFYGMDATVDLDQLISEASPFHKIMEEITVIYLYTYPTLLMRLIPLLEYMTTRRNGTTRAVVTLTYHLPEENVLLENVDEKYDMKLYTQIKASKK